MRVHAINALPISLAGLAPNGAELAQFQSAFNDFASGAGVMAGNADFLVRTAQSVHAAAETSLQVLGAATIVGGGVELLAEEGCEAFAGYVAKQIVSLGVAQVANAVAANAMQLAAKLGVDPQKVQIFADGLQLLFLVKAAREAELASQSNCFVAGTEVITGTDPSHPGAFGEKPIQDIHQGDQVLTRDQNNPNAPLEERRVTQTFVHTVFAIEDVTVRGSNGSVETIRSTLEHPYYVIDLGWTGSSQLIAGEQLMEDDGTRATVVTAAEELHPEGISVYNFTVSDDHTYFVDQGGAAVWVHNTCADARELRDNLIRDDEEPAVGDQAAHIVPTGGFSNRSALVQNSIRESQKILEDADIDLNDAENGFFTNSSSHNGTHTDDYFVQMGEALKRTGGNRAAVIQMLESLKGAALDGHF